MHPRLFAHYLVSAGLVTPDVMVEALNLQATRHTKIGKLALRHGVMRAEQVFHVLSVQPGSGKRFGELAQELGFASAREIDELLQLQHDTVPSIEELLLESGASDRDTLADARERFEHSLQPA